MGGWIKSEGGWIKSDRALAIALIVSAAFYRPLVFWAANAWELSDVSTPLLFGLGLAVVGLSVYAVGSKFMPDLPPAIAISVIMIVLVHWTRLEPPTPILLLVAALVAAFAIGLLRPKMGRSITLALVVLLAGGPVAQLLVSHFNRASTLPTIELPIHDGATATGEVEDVLVVVTDSYPALAVAENWFGHDVSALRDSLEGLGYTLPYVAWSQHTFTTFSIPAMLQLQPVVDVGSDEEWENSRDLYEMMQGDNLVADTLRSAGFEYTHVESGLDHSSCGSPDVCIGNSWLNEITWHLIKPTILGGSLLEPRRSWMVETSLTAHDELLDLAPIFDDGKRDYVFAHLMLPHEPYVVDESCAVVPQNGGDDSKESVGNQLACADGLLADVAAIAGEKTAAIVTADHGTKTRGQIEKPPSEWTSADIAEVFGIFLAYRLPDGCEPPTQALNTYVMRAIMSCAVGLDPPPNSGDLLIGLHRFRWVQDSERQAIEARLVNGNLTIEGGEVLRSSVSHEDS